MPLLIISYGANKGKAVITKLGAAIGAIGAICACACSSIISVCGSDETCKHWCEQTLAPNTPYKYRARHCDCPCLGRLDYPPLSGLIWKDLAFNIGYSARTGGPPADSTTTILAAHVAPDGTTINPTVNQLWVGAGGNLGGCETSIPGNFVQDQRFDTTPGTPNIFAHDEQLVTVKQYVSTPCPSQVRFVGMIGSNDSSPLVDTVTAPALAGLGDTPYFLHIYAYFDSGWVDRCFLETGVNGNAVSNAPFLTSAGTYHITPRCFDCAGILNGTDGSPASICAYRFDVFVDLPDGLAGALVTHHYRLYNTIDNRWIGVDDNGYTGSIEPLDVDPDDPTVTCCKKHGLKDPTCGTCICQACWKMILNDSNGSQYYYISKGGGSGGVGSCPDTIWTRILGTTQDLTSAGFVGGCGP